MCTYSHIQCTLAENPSCHRFVLLINYTVTVVAGGFCSGYSNDLYAAGIYI